jgi:hypothetical protein
MFVELLIGQYSKRGAAMNHNFNPQHQVIIQQRLNIRYPLCIAESIEEEPYLGERNLYHLGQDTWKNAY